MNVECPAEEIKKANIIYHARMADTYNQDQPQYRPENIKRVTKAIRNLAKYGRKTLLDAGCGTGFIINIGKKYFDQVIGIDITKEMLDKVDLSGGNITLQLADSSNMPFQDEVFNVCTAYGVLHHLPKLEPTLKEVFRCLKKGGIFYADQEPNYYFWKEIKGLKKAEVYTDSIREEIDSVCGVCDTLENKFGLSKKIISLAEYQKIIRGGTKKEEITELLEKIGFSSIDFEYQWFLGQRHLIGKVPPKLINLIENHLKECLPASKNLFKYFSFTATKEG